MKKKLLAMLLVVVTLMSVLGTGVFAAAPKTLQSYLDNKSVKFSHSTITIVLSSDTVVDTDTVIPANVKVTVTNGAKLTVSARLAVFGTLNVASSDLLITTGSISYPKCNYCYGYQHICYYCGFNCPGVVVPGTPGSTVIPGSYCAAHKTGRNFCIYCREYYCLYCEGGSHVYNTVTRKCHVSSDGFKALCPNHKTAMAFCDVCDVYYCKTCLNGEHVYNSTLKRCEVKLNGVTCAPTGATCPIHKTLHSYCSDCKSVYCSSCVGGVHVKNPASGKCDVYTGMIDSHNVCTIHRLQRIYCEMCKVSYCVNCAGGTHIYNSTTHQCVVGSNICHGTGSCLTHHATSLYCGTCKINYCPYCNGGYYHTVVGGHCYVTSGSYVNGCCPNVYGNYVYIPGYGYVYGHMAVKAPYATIAAGKVNAGSDIYLKCATSAATIYYTTDGSSPKAITANMYRGEKLTITKNTTIRAIAVMGNGLCSEETVLKYTVVVPAQPVDNTEANFNTLVNDFTKDGILPEKFTAKSAVSYKVLFDAMKAIGLDTDLANLDEDDFKNAEKLTNEEMIYAAYRIMRTNKIISQADGRSDSVMLAMKYRKETTDLSRYKIAYAAMIEADVLVDLEFKPQEAASANLFVHIIDWAQASL